MRTMGAHVLNRFMPVRRRHKVVVPSIDDEVCSERIVLKIAFSNVWHLSRKLWQILQNDFRHPFTESASAVLTGAYYFAALLYDCPIFVCNLEPSLFLRKGERDRQVPQVGR